MRTRRARAAPPSIDQGRASSSTQAGPSVDRRALRNGDNKPTTTEVDSRNGEDGVDSPPRFTAAEKGKGRASAPSPEEGSGSSSSSSLCALSTSPLRERSPSTVAVVTWPPFPWDLSAEPLEIQRDMYNVHLQNLKFATMYRDGVNDIRAMLHMPPMRDVAIVPWKRPMLTDVDATKKIGLVALVIMPEVLAHRYYARAPGLIQTHHRWRIDYASMSAELRAEHAQSLRRMANDEAWRIMQDVIEDYFVEHGASDVICKKVTHSLRPSEKEIDLVVRLEDSLAIPSSWTSRPVYKLSAVIGACQDYLNDPFARYPRNILDSVFPPDTSDESSSSDGSSALSIAPELMTGAPFHPGRNAVPPSQTPISPATRPSVDAKSLHSIEKPAQNPHQGVSSEERTSPSTSAMDWRETGLSTPDSSVSSLSHTGSSSSYRSCEYSSSSPAMSAGELAGLGLLDATSPSSSAHSLVRGFDPSRNSTREGTPFPMAVNEDHGAKRSRELTARPVNLTKNVTSVPNAPTPATKKSRGSATRR